MPFLKLGKSKSDSVSSTEGRIRYALGDQLFQGHWPRNLGTLILATMMAAVLASGQGHTNTGLWLIVMALLTCARIALTLVYQKQNKEIQKLPRWEGLFVLITGFIGFWWGWLVFCYFPLGNLDHQSFLIFCVAGLSAVSIPYLGYVRRAFFVFVIPIVVSLIVSFVMSGQNEKILIVMLYTLLLILSAIRYRRILYRSLELRFQNEELLGDVSDARDRAEAATRAKSEFISTISHEIRTPMNGFLGMLQLLEDTPLNKEQRDYLGTAASSAETLHVLLNDILDFSKIEAGKLEIESINFDIWIAVNETAALMQSQATAKGLNFICKVANELPKEVTGDPTRLRQILSNLLSNAIKFTKKGYVKIQVDSLVEKGNEVIRFRVSDTGIGIDEETQKKLFSAFSQADSSTSRNFGGTGLGLAISKQLTELMGGNISLSSELGKGSIFTLQIPFKAVRSKDAQDSEMTRSLEKPHKPGAIEGSVLVVEDDHVSQRVANLMLSRMGLEVSLAANGREGVELVQTNSYDMVFMDGQMPIMTGAEAVTVIREWERQSGRKEIPIIALSANVSSEDRVTFMMAGMNDVLAKPIKQHRLLACINRWMGEQTSEKAQSESILSEK
jgi:signal transduction histidine kinase/CheY-like chemotaxis protein